MICILFHFSLAFSQQFANFSHITGFTGGKTNKKMKLNELIKAVSKLVETRETIDHGSIRCLHSDNAVNEIMSCEACDDVDTGTVGDDDLAAELAELADNGDRIADLHLEDLVKLEDAYRGDDITDYLEDEKEDELRKLDSLIEAARELV